MEKIMVIIVLLGLFSFIGYKIIKNHMSIKDKKSNGGSGGNTSKDDEIISDIKND